MNLDTLSTLTDEQLREKLGMDAELAKVKTGIKAALALKGEARKIAEKRVKDLFEPKVSPWSFEHLAMDAEREAKRKTGKGQYADTSPCGCM